MATFNVFTELGLTPINVFPAAGITQGAATETEKFYTFSINGASRTILVTGTNGGSGGITMIQAVRLYDADGTTVLAEFTDVDDVALADFEEAWLQDKATPNDVFALLLGGGSVLNGSDGDDRFVGGTGDDTINGYSDFINFTTIDYVDYSHRNTGIVVDFVDGDAEDDEGTVSIGQEADILIGIGGIYATAHADHLAGDIHDNEFWAGLGNDTVIGGGGFDIIGYNGPETRTKGIVVEFASEQAGTVVGENGEADIFSEIEAVYGTQFGDRFIGAEGYQRFRGFAGNDTFNGGAGDDEVDYRNDTRQIDGTGIRVDLSKVEGDGSVLVQGVNGDTDKLFNIEFIRGSRDNDTITGSSASNRLRGDAGDDRINGLGGDDRLEGGAGNDTLNGGAGWDTLDGGAGDDVLIGGVGASTDEDYFVGGSGNDTIYGGEVAQDDDPNTNWNDLSYMDSGLSGITVTFNDNGDRYGSGTVLKPEGSGKDTFYNVHVVRGTNGNDTFIGGESGVPQRFVGYAGNDTFDGAKGVNEIDYRAEYRAASDDLKKGMTIDLRGGDTVTVTDLTGAADTLIQIERVRGTEEDDEIYGNDLDNRLRGDNGNDLLTGEAGDDRLEGGAGWDTLDGGIGNDILVGGVGAATDEDYFLGSSGNDTIFGADFAQDDDPNQNWNDLSYYNRGFSGITATFNDFTGRYGTGTVQKKADGGLDAGTDTFFNINAVRGTNGEDVFVGGQGTVVQRFVGFAGDDLFDGTKGINEIDYRAEARAAGRTTGMIIDLGTVGSVEITDASGDTDTLIQIERLRGTDYGDELYGNALSNRLRGDGGDDLVEGRHGIDRLEGGEGNDTLNGGSNGDTLLGDAGNDRLNGDDHNDSLIGGAGNDTLNGGAGDDVFEGGEGNDVVDGGPMTEDSFDELTYRNVETDGITVQISTQTANSGRVTNDGSGGQDTFTNINSIVGTQVDDTFVGGIGNHRFVGLAGDDTFVGGSGNTEVDYRLEARIAQWTKGLAIDLGEGLTATVTVKDAMGGTDTLTNIKRIRGTDGSDAISGNTFGNRLRGEAGDDVLRGRNGDDTIEGGVGNDIAAYSGSRSDYHVENNGTQLTITDQRVNGEGKDTVIDVESFNFGGTVLNLAEVINHGSAINLAGGMVLENSATGVDIGTLSVANPDALSTHTYTLVNDAGGRFQLASDNRTIEVKNGLLLDYEQTMTHTVVVRATDQFGKSVDQTLTIVLQDVAKETTTGTSGGDTVSGGSNTDNLSGGAGNDSLNGGGGKDKINGGTGQDSLTGGSGKDIFTFANKDTGTSKATADYITDFSGRGGDKIDLKLIDADTKKKGDQAFSFIGQNAFTKAGQVRYEKAGKDTYVYLNTDGDKAAEGVIKLKGAMDLQKSWFVL